MKMIYCFAVAALTLNLASISGCKKLDEQSWTESDIQGLQNNLGALTPPSSNILARIKILEREQALRIFDAWAAKILASQKQDPRSPLNQLRKIFNPDHLKPLTLESALITTRQEGSGQHASLIAQRKPQDYVYHALWSRMADAASLTRYPRAGKHMKHYLANSGKKIQYSQMESSKIISAADSVGESPAEPVGVQIEKSELKEAMKKAGFELSDSEAEMIASMNRTEKAFYVSRLQLRMSLAEFAARKILKNPEDLVAQLKNLKNKGLPSRFSSDTGAWQSFRPMAKAHRLVSSPAQSDMYFAMGSFSTAHVALPLEATHTSGLIKIRFSQWKTFYDRYNWDEGKFVTLLSGWCWNLQSDHCFNIEELISIQVSDKSLARLHKIGIAREYEIFGQTAPSTVWDAVNFNDLMNPRKREFWQKLISVIQSLSREIFADDFDT